LRHIREHRSEKKKNINEELFKNNFENIKKLFKHIEIPIILHRPIEGIYIHKGFKCSSCIKFFITFSSAGLHIKKCGDGKPIPHLVQAIRLGNQTTYTGIQSNVDEFENNETTKLLLHIYNDIEKEYMGNLYLNYC
jgi:hypothetical protein